ncbi:putative tetratricopeptide repeat domain-containing protein [Eutypa lata UCREL1]|uniref:Putative tetratricopeptide repeat domain-containing protein n=1 Tax=Eutypa lata (strain UCR-EL1) TaxID=1287681 RepID=M7STG1_EUTLA|nr:putative tetratricopeptide repeat domain-containing protein [Eutypa lata UCREL1]
MSELPLKEWPSNRATEGTSLSGFELVYPTTPNHEIQKTLHLPCYLLNTHSANADFCGREDILERLAAELLPSKNIVTASGTALRQFTLYGFGGIGKTEIAREFSRRHKASFDAVFWVVADEIAKLDHHYQQISLALGLEDPSECKSQVVSREIVKGWLSNSQKHLSGLDEFVQSGQGRSEATWLLIFDNADDPIILADYWPQGSGSILITSRDPLAKNMFTSRPSGLDLGPLTQQDSLSLFSHLTTSSNDSEDDIAQQISNALGGVPLAISQMAGIIRRQDLTLSEFLELYTDREEHASLYETKFDTNLITYRHSLSTVWAFEKLKPQARQMLELISFLDPDVIGEDLLMEASVELFSEGTHFKKSNYNAARADLLQSSLVQRDKQKQQISVHRIVQDAVLATMDATKKQFMFDQVVRILWADWPSAMPKPSKVPYLPQPKSTGVSKICRELGTEDERLYLAYAERGISRIQDRRFEEGEADLKEALRVRKALGNYIPRSGEANLSWALLAQGKLEECNTLLLDSLAGREKALGKDDRESVRTGLILYVLGNLRAAQNQWDESFEYHQRAWRHMRATVGERDFYTANITHKIAEHLIRLGRNEEAIATINGALEIWSVDPSAHRNEIARTTFLKAKLFEVTGKMQKASIALRVASRLRKEISKEDRDAKTLTKEDFDEIVVFWAR